MCGRQATTHPRLAGVDFGTKRVGLALTDPLRLFAQPLGAFTPADAVDELQRLQKEEGLEAIVIGWPLTEAGAEEAAVARVQEYINRLERRMPGVAIIRWDERYTSELAKRKIKQAGRRKGARGKKGRIDAAAAAIILQEYLDAAAGTF